MLPAPRAHQQAKAVPHHCVAGTVEKQAACLTSSTPDMFIGLETGLRLSRDLDLNNDENVCTVLDAGDGCVFKSKGSQEGLLAFPVEDTMLVAGEVRYFVCAHCMACLC